MKIGIVGYQGSGKSTLFGWLTGVAPDPARAHEGQSAMAHVPDERVDQLAAIYHPKKITQAALELVDTPGLARDHQGNPQRLAQIREAGCLVVVVAAYDATDAAADLASFEEDLLLADLEIVSGRVDRLRESVKRPRPNRDAELAELAALEPLVEVLESGTALCDVELHDDQRRATSSFRLLTEKPRLVVLNTADDAADTDATDGDALAAALAEKLAANQTSPQREQGNETSPTRQRGMEESDPAHEHAAAHPAPKHPHHHHHGQAHERSADAAHQRGPTTVRAISVRLQMELAAMEPADRDELVADMQLTVVDRGELLRQIMAASTQTLFFTAGEKEVRSWLIRRGATAVEAAGSIHTDLARGFIRAETITCEDLVRLGSEREVKAAGLVRQEPKDYVLQDGDVVNIKFSV